MRSGVAPADMGWGKAGRTALLVAPGLIVIALLFLWPLGLIVVKSAPGGDLSNYWKILSAPVYLQVILRTFQTCLLVTVLTLILAYPYAYLMSISRGWRLMLLGAVLLLPFWVSLLLRTYAWLILLQNTGVVNTALQSLGLTDAPLQLARDISGVVIGMTHILLPYAVLALYSVMKKIDPRQIEAATICGAGPIRTFWRVYLPLSLPGVLSGAVLVFALGLGFYITPALLGGPRDTLIGQLVANSVQVNLDLPFGSALAVILLILTGTVFALFALMRLLMPAMFPKEVRT